MFSWIEPFYEKPRGILVVDLYLSTLFASSSDHRHLLRDYSVRDPRPAKVNAVGHAAV
jgi:hypothetical protein